jgi:hypothetical protein
MVDQHRTPAGRPERGEGCAGASCDPLVSPIPRIRPRPLHVTTAPRRRVTFIDSGKPNSAQILELATAILAARGVEVGESLRKPRASRLVGEELLARAGREEGLVLFAVND